MDGNREEAKRCLEKAKKEFTEFEKSSNDKRKFENVLRLAKKSERMYPSMDAKRFLATLSTHEFTKNNDINDSSTAKESKSGPKLGANKLPNGKTQENGNK